MFDAARDELYFLMSKDNFARFKKSEYFRQLLLNVQNYKKDIVDKEKVEKVTRRLSKTDASNKDRAALEQIGRQSGSFKKTEEGFSVFDAGQIQDIANKAAEHDENILSTVLKTPRSEQKDRETQAKADSAKKKIASKASKKKGRKNNKVKGDK